MKTPIQLWIVGLVSLLWNAGGAYDYVMSQMKNQAYLGMLTDAQRGFLENAPAWFDAAWAVGVWFSILGSLLLLARSRLARPAFGFSLLGLIVSSVYSFGFAKPTTLEITGSFALWFSTAIAVVLVLLWRYARAMTRRGMLR
jgi:hypothetical protein